MVLVTSDNKKWKSTPYSGIEMCILRRNEEKGGTVLLKFSSGARFPLHNHPGGEELYVLKGSVSLGGQRLSEGDYVWTEPNMRHDAVAHEESLLFVSTPKGIEVLELLDAQQDVAADRKQRGG